MESNIMAKLEVKAQQNPLFVAFPEATEINVLKAAALSYERKIAHPVLIGKEEDIRKAAEENHIDISGIKIRSNQDRAVNTKYAQDFIAGNQMFSEKKLNKLMENHPLYFGAVMAALDEADAMIAGYAHTTADVILASQFIIGLEKGISIASSLFLMDVPGFKGSEGSLIVLADGGVCESPSPSELADITITTAETARALLNWEPRIALLSYSTKGSASSKDTAKVIDALNQVKERRPDLKIDGEMQLDAAVAPAVAAKKVGSGSPVAGKANILIVPDLTAGNILYKAIQQFGNAKAYGPFLQGFKKTVSDLSRGSSVDDIYGVTVMAVVTAQNKKNSTKTG